MLPPPPPDVKFAISRKHEFVSLILLQFVWLRETPTEAAAPAMMTSTSITTSAFTMTINHDQTQHTPTLNITMTRPSITTKPPQAPMQQEQAPQRRPSSPARRKCSASTSANCSGPPPGPKIRFHSKESWCSPLANLNLRCHPLSA